MALHVGPYEGGAAEWDELAEAHGCIYNHFGFGEALRLGMRHEILRICARDQEGIRAHVALSIFSNRIFGRCAVSLPVSDHAGLCSMENEATYRLVEYLKMMGRRRGLEYVELRHIVGQPNRPDDLPAREDKLTLVAQLPTDSGDLWASLGPKVRNLVRKGEKARLDVLTGGMELLDSFFSVYLSNLRDLGVPCYPKAFFAALMGAFPTKVSIHVVRSQGQVVASALTLTDERRQRVPFAASLRTARPKAPNMFLYWHLLEDAIKRDCEVFDFGRSKRNSGTYRFKRQWGGAEMKLNWQYCHARRETTPWVDPGSSHLRIAMAVWKRLPVTITALLGPRIMRHLP